MVMEKNINQQPKYVPSKQDKAVNALPFVALVVLVLAGLVVYFC